MQYVIGGEFFTHLRSANRFPNDTARFYAAAVVLAFEHLHDQNIIFRGAHVVAHTYMHASLFARTRPRAPAALLEGARPSYHVTLLHNGRPEPHVVDARACE